MKQILNADMSLSEIASILCEDYKKNNGRYMTEEEAIRLTEEAKHCNRKKMERYGTS